MFLETAPLWAIVELPEARRALRTAADPARAAFLSRFFQGRPGGYGEGDRFLGVTVPTLRRIARDLRTLDLPGVVALIRSPFHEERLLGLFVLAERHRKAKRAEKLRLARLYLRLRRFVNNWDLVDSSAPYVLGTHLDELGATTLRRLASSRSVWDRRIAVLATCHEIRRGESRRFLALAKAVGWMLREVGERDRAALASFLRTHQRRMPRTMLRYAIEKLGKAERRAYLAGRG